MTKEQIDAVLDRVRTWPKERREYAARVLLDLEAEVEGGAYVLSESEREDIDASIAAADRGEFA